MTSYLLPLLVPFLTDLGLGDSHLVNLSLCYLTLFFFVISFIHPFLSLFFVIFDMLCASLHKSVF